MTDETGQKPASGAENPPAGPDAAPATPPGGTETIARLEAEVAELKDRLLRSLAEMENVRGRADREVQDARRYAVTGFSREILALGDNLRRTLEAVPAEVAEAEGGALKALLDGVAVTEREFLNILGKHGIRRMEPKGSRFDPNLHQAMYEVPAPDVPAGTIVEVIQPGYTIGGRTLRPALVGIAKGGPKGAKPAEPSRDDETDIPADASPGDERG